MKKMYGVNTPLSCPMTKTGEVDYEGLKNLCNFLVEHGIHGLYPNGSTGEMCYLTLEERKKILEVTVETVAGRSNVFAMVGANTTRDTIELAQHAEKVGADGIGVVTPYYFKLSDAELIQYFVDVAKSVSPDFPVYLYGIPQLAVNDVTPAMAEAIVKQCPNVVGVKYSYPDMIKMLKFMDVNNGNFSVLTGPEDLFYAILASGGDGVISGSSNVMPEYFVAIYDAFKAGNYELAAKLQAKTNRILAILNAPGHMSRYKVGMRYRGIIEDATMRRPLQEITAEEEKTMLAALEAMDFLDPSTVV